MNANRYDFDDQDDSILSATENQLQQTKWLNAFFSWVQQTQAISIAKTREPNSLASGQITPFHINKLDYPLRMPQNGLYL